MPRLHPLSYLDEGEQVVIGRTDTDSYGVFPPDGAELVRRLAAGAAPEEAALWYEETYGEPVDVADFLETLDELGFLAGPGEDGTTAGTAGAAGNAANSAAAGTGTGSTGTTGSTAAASPPVRWQRLGRWAFSIPAWIAYALLVGGTVAAMATRPRLMPHTGNLFFTHYVTLIALTLWLGQIPLLLWHESFHALAGRRLGIRSKLRLSYRLYFLVFETHLDGLAVKPRRQRYLPMLAGMVADVLAICVLTWVAVALGATRGRMPMPAGMFLALAFGTTIRLGWQFYFYLRTDLYFVAIVALGCQDLHTAARRILGNRFRRLRGRPVLSEEDLFPRDRRIGRWYSWLLLVGYTFSLSVLALVGIPALVRSSRIAVGRFTHTGTTWSQALDSTVFLAVNAVQFGLVGLIAVRNRLRRRRRASPTPSS